QHSAAQLYPVSRTAPSHAHFDLYCYRYPRDLHSFPTRRSSDLIAKEAIAKFRNLLTEGGAEIIHEDNWGLKKLAYPIEKKSTGLDRKSTRLNSSHVKISYAVFCLKKKKIKHDVSVAI